MDNNKHYNSLNFKKEEIQLATGYISATTIYFEIEKVYVVIEAKGHIEFYNQEKEILASLDLPKQTGGREVYSTVICSSMDDVICMEYPIVKWIDNYPHCDGEHDRWDLVTIGHHKVYFNLHTNEVTCE